MSDNELTRTGEVLPAPEPCPANAIHIYARIRPDGLFEFRTGRVCVAMHIEGVIRTWGPIVEPVEDMIVWASSEGRDEASTDVQTAASQSMSNFMAYMLSPLFQTAQHELRKQAAKGGQ